MLKKQDGPPPLSSGVSEADSALASAPDHDTASTASLDSDPTRHIPPWSRIRNRGPQDSYVTVGNLPSQATLGKTPATSVGYFSSNDSVSPEGNHINGVTNGYVSTSKIASSFSPNSNYVSVKKDRSYDALPAYSRFHNEQIGSTLTPRKSYASVSDMRTVVSRMRNDTPGSISSGNRVSSPGSMDTPFDKRRQMSLTSLPNAADDKIREDKSSEVRKLTTIPAGNAYVTVSPTNGHVGNGYLPNTPSKDSKPVLASTLSNPVGYQSPSPDFSSEPIQSPYVKVAESQDMNKPKSGSSNHISKGNGCKSNGLLSGYVGVDHPQPRSNSLFTRSGLGGGTSTESVPLKSNANASPIDPQELIRLGINVADNSHNRRLPSLFSGASTYVTVKGGPFQSKPQHYIRHPQESSTEDVRLVVSAPTENIRERLHNKDEESEPEQVHLPTVHQRPNTSDAVLGSVQRPSVGFPAGSNSSSGYVSQEAIFGSDPLSPKKLYGQTSAAKNPLVRNNTLMEVSFV